MAEPHARPEDMTAGIGLRQPSQVYARAADQELHRPLPHRGRRGDDHRVAAVPEHAGQQFDHFRIIIDHQNFFRSHACYLLPGTTRCNDRSVKLLLRFRGRRLRRSW